MTQIGQEQKDDKEQDKDLDSLEPNSGEESRKVPAAPRVKSGVEGCEC